MTTPFRCAYVGGTFDLLHRGHHALFAATRRIAATVVVSVNSDAFAARYKRQPVQPLADRLMNIAQLRTVDRAMVNVGDEDSRPAILLSGADCVVHGSDWTGDALLQQMSLSEAWLAAHGIALTILPYTPWTSTTQVLQAFDGMRQPVTCLHGNSPDTCAHCQMWRDRWIEMPA